MTGSDFIRNKLPWILLVLVLLVNGIQAGPDVLLFGKGILDNITKPGLWRAAKFTNSRNFADYVLFLNEQIPEDALVVIPPESEVMRTLANNPAMEYFLAPREIRNCTDLACGRAFIDQENTYLLIIGRDRFPGEPIEDHPERIRMFNDTWGVYGPEDGLGTGTVPGFGTGLLTLVRGILAPLLTFLLWFAAGGMLIRWLMPELDPWVSLGVGYGLILGLQSLVLYLALLLGLEAPAGVLLVFWMILLLILASGWYRGRFSPAAWAGGLTSTGEGWPFRLGLAGLGGLLTYLAVGSGLYATDSYVLWGAKGAGILSQGLEGVLRGTNTTRYPLHIPLLIAGQGALFGDVLPASKLIFPGYYFSLTALVYGTLRRETGESRAGLAALAAATMPVMMRHGRIGYANLPTAFYLVSGAVMIAAAGRETEAGESSRLQYLGGTLLALAIWTRPEGIWLILAVLAAAAVWFLVPGRAGTGHFPWRLILPPLLLWTAWLLTSRTFYSQVPGSRGFAEHLLEDFARGRFRLGDLGHITVYLGKQLINPGTWGTAGTGALLLWAAAASGEKKVSPEHRFLAAASALCVLVIVGIYYTFAFEPDHELSWWLKSGFNRMLLPGMTLLWVSAAGAWGTSRRADD